MKRTHRGSRAATTATGHEKLDRLLALVEDVKKFIPDEHLMDSLDVLGEMEEIIREVGEEVENYTDEPSFCLRDVVADYLRGLADEDDLRRVLSENSNVAVPA